MAGSGFLQTIAPLDRLVAVAFLCTIARLPDCASQAFSAWRTFARISSGLIAPESRVRRWVKLSM